MPTDPRTRRGLTILSDDVLLVADAVGDPNDVPVVLLHGGGQTRHSWGTTALRLAKGGWLGITVDLRGHGDSGWSRDGRYHLDDFANDVVNIVEHLGRAPVLVGASLGGVASLAALARRPELALGLVLVDVSPFVRPEGTRRICDFMTARPDGFTSLGEAADAVSQFLPHRAPQDDFEGLRRNLREEDGRLYWHWDPNLLRSPSDPDRRGNTLIDPVHLGGAAASLRLPTLLIRGRESDVLGHDDSRRFLEMVAHAEFRELAGARHMVAGDDNENFGAVLEDFLTRRLRPRLDLLADA